MDAKQRFLRRQWLIDNIEIVLREIAYHRALKKDATLPGYILTNDLTEESSLEISDLYVDP